MQNHMHETKSRGRGPTNSLNAAGYRYRRTLSAFDTPIYVSVKTPQLPRSALSSSPAPRLDEGELRMEENFALSARIWRGFQAEEGGKTPFVCNASRSIRAGRLRQDERDGALCERPRRPESSPAQYTDPRVCRDLAIILSYAIWQAR